MAHSHQGGCGCINPNFYRYDNKVQGKTSFRSLPKKLRAKGADILIKAKHILTMDPKQADVTAVVIRDGRIAALGQESALKDWITKDTVVLDYQDNTILPGFIESHSHPLLLGMGLKHVNLSFDFAPTRAKVLEAIGEWAKSHPERKWVIGWGYDPSVLDDVSPLTRKELDAICLDRPVLIVNTSLHLAYVNSRTFEAAGIDKNTKDPIGAHYTRTADGELHGEIVEIAALLPVMAKIPPMDFEQLVDSAYACANMFRKQGFTTIVDAGLGLAAHHDDLACYRAVAHNPDFPVRIIACPMSDIYHPGIAWTDIGDDHLKLGAIKYVIDGSLQGFTANLSEPYFAKPETSGKSTVDEQVFRDNLLKTHLAGNQAFIHANGDKAVDMALDAIEHVLSVQPRVDHRHRIEHCQITNPKQLTRMKDLGVYPNFFVSHVYFWGDVHVKATLGEARAQNIDPVGWAKQANLTYTFHSDAPVTLPNAIKTLWIACNRKTRTGKVLGQEHCITPLEALKAMTIDAAYLLHEEHKIGSIEVGKLGDFTVLDKNPLEIPVADLDKIKIVTTILGGLDTNA